MARIDLHITGDDKADAVLSRDPLALLIGMVLDQQIPIEKAFSSPADLVERLGGKGPLNAAAIAAMDPDELAGIFREQPALHRYPGIDGRPGAGRLPRSSPTQYGNRADAVWKGAQSGDELLARLRALPGFGEQKAKIFAALLGKQLDVRLDGWREGHHPLRQGGQLPLGGGHHQSGEPRQGAGHQEGAEGQGEGSGRRRRRVTGGPDLSRRRLYLCTPDRPDLADFVDQRHRRRCGRGPAARQGARRQAAGGPGRRGSGRAPRPWRCRSC